MGYIYILTNPLFPEYIKIGYAENVEKELEELNLYVPIPYCIYSIYEVSSNLSGEKIHTIIDSLNSNLHTKGDFYTVSPQTIYSILELMAQIHGCENKLRLISQNNYNSENKNQNSNDSKNEIINEKVEKLAERSVNEVTDQKKSEHRADQFPFDLCKIPVGAELEFYQEGNKNSGIKCKLLDIQGWRKENIEYMGKRYSLSSLAKELIPSENNVQGVLFFKYKGELLNDIRRRLGV